MYFNRVVGYGPVISGPNNNTPPSKAVTFVSSPREDLIKNPEPLQLIEITNTTPPPASCDANNGLTEVGLPVSTNAENTPHHYTFTTELKAESPLGWKVYYRGRWCRKKKAHNSEIVKLKAGDNDTNIQQQPKVALDNYHETNIHPPQPLCENLDAPPDHMVKDALPTDNVDSTVFLMEAEDHWNMAKQLGITCDMDHHSFIKSFSDMEDRDLKEAEKLGNRLGAS